MTKVLAGARRNGKTSELIRMAAKEGLYIVTSTKQCAQHIAAQARRMGIDNLLYPVTLQEAHGLRCTAYDTHKGRILVDNVDVVLSLLLNMPVEAMTVTTPEQADTNLLLTCTNTAPWAACGDDVFECSNCGWDDLCCDIRDDELNYCPNCGAKIIKEEANDGRI